MIFVKTNEKNEMFGKLCEKNQDMRLFEEIDEQANANGMREVVLLYYNNQALGCGSYKYFSEDTAEFNNIYLDKVVRNRKTIQQLLFRLEDNAKRAGYQYAVFAISKYVTNDIEVFKELEYTVIPNYGYYEDNPNAVCLRKRLV